MDSAARALLGSWHRTLRLSRQSPLSWHRDRLREELRERRLAKTPWHKLSETSDVLFSISRARYDGFPLRKPPPVLSPNYLVAYMYMLAKYTSRWAFYRTAAFLCGASNPSLVREVVNPGKDSKLLEVASRYQIDSAKFSRTSRQLRRVWPLLP